MIFLKSDQGVGRVGHKLIMITILLMVLLFDCGAVYANDPYAGYNYNVWNQSVPSPNSYLPEKSIRGEDLGIGRFNKPQDMFIDRNKDLYVLDSGNNRIVILDSDLKLKKVIDRFIANGSEINLNEPTGICVAGDGLIYMADSGNGRIIAINKDGSVVKNIGKPVSDIIPSEFSYKPEKVLVDNKNIIYVMAYGVYEGIITFDSGGRFLEFYGSNRVEVTLALLSDLFWRSIFTRKQKESMVRFVPVEYSNFDIDDNDFIYTTTVNTENSKNEIKKLNPMGVNILRHKKTAANGSALNDFDYGDQESYWFRAALQDTSFIDITIDNDNIISALDQARGRIFQYDQESNLLCIFGGLGDQLGTFSKPSAIENLNGKILVLDSDKSSITVFRATPYGEYVRDAVKLYNQGKYEDALKSWNEVLKRNSNFELAYVGIGEALMKKEDFKGAMYNFNLGYDRDGYDKAFDEYRKDFVRGHFSIMMLGFLCIILFIWLLLNRKRLAHFLIKVKKGDFNG